MVALSSFAIGLPFWYNFFRSVTGEKQ